MQLYQIDRRLNIAIDTFRMNDIYLLIKDVNERSITHKLATYMEQTFGKTYDVDCEYNRSIEESKTIRILKSKWEELNKHVGIAIAEDDALIDKTVYPDIIVHKRGKSNQNLLIIEVKKSTSSVTEDYDIEKLKCYTNPNSDLKYQYGVFIKFYASITQYQSPDIRYFCNAAEIYME